MNPRPSRLLPFLLPLATIRSTRPFTAKVGNAHSCRQSYPWLVDFCTTMNVKKRSCSETSLNADDKPGSGHSLRRSRRLEKISRAELINEPCSSRQVSSLSVDLESRSVSYNVESTIAPNQNGIRRSNKPGTTKASDRRTEDGGILLLDIGTLVRGTVLKRPSATIRSPYVADVRLDGDDDFGGGGGLSGTTVLAHAPALDVGGLCSPGSAVYMSRRPEGGKTSHAIELVVCPAPGGGGGTEDVLVGAHPRLGERLAERALELGLLEGAIGFGPARRPATAADDRAAPPSNGVTMSRQCTIGDSRVDFVLEKDVKGSDAIALKTKAVIEVKNVVCADYCAAHAPNKTGPNHCVITADVPPEQYERCGLFPWGRVGQTFEGSKVVSARAIKHVRNLTQMQGNDATLTAVVLFVVNRGDCIHMRACAEACPTFAKEVHSAAERGVVVTGFRARWTKDGKVYFDGMVPLSS